MPAFAMNRVLLMGAMLLGSSSAAEAIEGTALLDALRNADEARAFRLIDSRIDLDRLDETGATALMWAVQRGNANLTRQLLEAGANPDIGDSSGLGPLQIAVGLGARDIALMLIAHGADVKAARDSGETVLMTAARAGQLEVMKHLIAGGADVNAFEGQFHQTALMWSAGYPEQVKLLIEHGADIEARTRAWSVADVIFGEDFLDANTGRHITRKGGYNALFFAVQKGDLESASALLDAGMDANVRAADGSTALLLALYKWKAGGKRLQGCATPVAPMTFAPDIRMAVLLLNRGASPGVASSTGHTPLHAAALALVPTGRMDLKECPAPIDEQHTKQDRNIAVDLEDGLKLVERLLRLDADPNAGTRYPTPGPIGRVTFSPIPVGATPAHVAAQSGNAKLMASMLEHGGDPNRIRGDGHSPLSLATKWDDVRVVETLLAHGGDLSLIYSPTDKIHATHGDGGSRRSQQTLLHIAAASGSHEVIEALGERMSALLDWENDEGETPLMLAESQDRSRYERSKQIAEALKVAEAMKLAGVSNGPDPNSIAVDLRTTRAIRQLLSQYKKETL
jgi:ankyrin repeat protein